jgi:hypothetical protein
VAEFFCRSFKIIIGGPVGGVENDVSRCLPHLKALCRRQQVAKSPLDTRVAAEPVLCQQKLVFRLSPGRAFASLTLGGKDIMVRHHLYPAFSSYLIVMALLQFQNVLTVCNNNLPFNDITV